LWEIAGFGAAEFPWVETVHSGGPLNRGRARERAAWVECSPDAASGNLSDSICGHFSAERLGRLPESTAHCRPKNGDPELLSICMNEPSYLHPAAVSRTVAAKIREVEFLIMVQTLQRD